LARGSIALSCGSLPDVPLHVPLLPELFGPIALTADPVVSKIPLVIPMFVVLPFANVPYAFVGQFKLTLVTVKPCPARLLTNVAAETPGVTVSCAETSWENKQRKKIPAKSLQTIPFVEK
jgi:hypothetical protein